MTTYDIKNATTSDYSDNIDDYEVPSLNVDKTGDLAETEWTNSKAGEYWGYFNTIPELKSAFIMAAIWNVGKGYKTDPNTETILEYIKGDGKQTFQDILFSMEVNKRVYGDAFAEIIWDKKTTPPKPINIKVLDPASIKIVFNKLGRIIRYEQMDLASKSGKSVKTWVPQDILHLSHNKVSGSIHGISDIESLEETIAAEAENFTDTRLTAHHQARPLVIWKLKTDDTTKINAFVAKVQNARKLGDDMFIPDDDDIVTHEIVNVNLNQTLFEWRNNITNKFYRALGLPLIIFGQAGSTESGGKIEYLAHQQVFEYNQKCIEEQLWNQLYVKIDLISPISLLENLQTDQAKDANQGLDLPVGDLDPNTITGGGE